MTERYAHIYVHLPFCEVICHYCDFYTVRAKHARHEEFFAALGAEARAAAGKLAPELKALYFGGGTPSVSPPGLLKEFIELFRDRITPQTEVTLEANPLNVTEENARAWKVAGINRVSLGIQSLDDQRLKRLGRTHKGAQAREALEICVREFGNVSADLIYGVPDQPEDEPAEHAELMARAGAKHISCYHLTIPNSHFLFRKLPGDEFAWAQINRIHERLSQLGFGHYEASNFGLPGFESRNNLNYWRGGPYWALGPSAHGFNGSHQRWWNVADWEAYTYRLQRGESVVEEVEDLSEEQRKTEILFTGLRIAAGIEFHELSARLGYDFAARHEPLFRRWEKEGLGTLANGRFIPSFSGRMLADELARRLL
jgi:oxygen-independent coproporphyrinogen-3 oxidase